MNERKHSLLGGELDHAVPVERPREQGTEPCFVRHGARAVQDQLLLSADRLTLPSRLH